MVEHEICLHTSALNYFGHVYKTGEDRLVLAVNREVDLYRAGAS